MKWATIVLKSFFFFFKVRRLLSLVGPAECKLKKNVKKSYMTNRSSNWQVSLCRLSCSFMPRGKSG